MLQDLTFKAFVFCLVDRYWLSVRNSTFSSCYLWIILLREFCPLKLSYQRRKQSTITNIDLIWWPSYIISIVTPRFCYFASPNINDNFNLDLGFTEILPHYWRFAQFLVIKFDENIKLSFTLYLIWSIWRRKFKIYSGQPGNLFPNSINVYFHWWFVTWTQPTTLLKKETLAQVFSCAVNFAKFLRKYFLASFSKHLQWLLLLDY